MIIEQIKSFSQNLIDRFKNPFGGTLILTWCFENWKLIVGVVSFSGSDKIPDRIHFIEEFLKSSTIYNLLIYPILGAFCAIILYLLLTNIALIIYSFFGAWVKPFILLKIDSNKIIEKKDYEQVKASLFSMQGKLDDVEKKYAISQSTTETLNQKIIEIEKEKQKIISESSDKINFNNQKYEERISAIANENVMKEGTIVSLQSELETISNENKKLLQNRSNRIDLRIPLYYKYFNNYYTISNTESEVLPADLLSKNTLTIALWAKLPPSNILKGSKVNNRYILGYDTNNGISKKEGQLYENAFGLSISPDEYFKAPQKVFFRFWISNSYCVDFQLESLELIHTAEKWFHVMIQWDFDLNIINLCIDGKINENRILVNREQVLDKKTFRTYWPEKFTGNIVLGNWMRKNPMHNFPFPIYRLFVTDILLDNQWLDTEMKNIPITF